MNIEFDKLPDSARLWIYQAERELNHDELATISDILSSFTQQWAAHGQPLSSGFRIAYSRFIILAVDESMNGASGCSIDGSTRVVKQIEDTLGVSLMDRTSIAFLKDDRVFTMKLNQLEEGLQNKWWSKETLTFNNLILAKGKLDTEWIVPASETWLRKYLMKVTAF